MAQSKSVDNLVLWDPIAFGADYVSEHIWEDSDGKAGEDREIQGFVFSEGLQQGLAKASITDVRRLPSRVLTIVSEDLPKHRSLHRELKARGGDVEYEVFPNPPSWKEMSNVGVGAVPAVLLARIAQWVA